MSNWASNAVITKAKAIYGNRLSIDDYNELLKKKTVGDVAEYLKNTPKFKSMLQDIQESSIHRGQLEELIKKANFDYIIRLIKFVEIKDKKFFEMNIIRREMDIIFSVIRSIISGGYQIAIAELPVYFVRHASFDIMEITKSKSIQELLQTIQNTPYYDLLLPFQSQTPEEIDYSQVEHVLREYFYDTAFERIKQNYKGKTRKELEHIFLSSIELQNVIKIYRLKKFYHATNEEVMKTLLLKYSRMSPSKIQELLSLENPDDLLKYMQQSEYKQYIDEDDYIYIEYVADQIEYRLAKRYMNYSFTAATVFASFVILSEFEQQNIFNVIEGIRYGLDENEIRKMLIY